MHLCTIKGVLDFCSHEGMLSKATTLFSSSLVCNVTSYHAQHLQTTIQALQAELRIQRDLNQLLQPPSEPLASEPTEEHERQARELFLLRRTLEEMELRIETQKQTLLARDDSIKKLLEMLHTKGPSTKASEEDHERTQRLAEAEMHMHHLENLLEQRDKEMAALREVGTGHWVGTPHLTTTSQSQSQGPHGLAGVLSRALWAPIQQCFD